MRRAIVLLALVAALGAGCRGDGDDSPSSGQAESRARDSALKSSVLQPEDLPRVFIRFDEGMQVRADLPRSRLRGSPTRFGRVQGWKARYRRPGSTQTRGPLVIESRVDLFKTADGARKELEAYGRDLPEGLRFLGRPPSGLGEDGFTATGRQGAGQFAVRFYLIAWRDEAMSASLLLNGFEGEFKLQQAVALARKQDGRMEPPS
jgi:hypothetical protein